MTVYINGVAILDASQITSGILALARLSGLTKDQLAAAAGLLLTQMESAVCSETEAGVIAAALIGYGRLTVLGFQFNPATGTFTNNPEYINNNAVDAYAQARNVNEYAEVILPAALQITQFRQYGDVQLTGDGVWKIQYLDIAGAWQDWVTGISTRGTSDWSNWDSTGGTVTALAIRLIATTMDTFTINYIRELEVKY